MRRLVLERLVGAVVPSVLVALGVAAALLLAARAAGFAGWMACGAAFVAVLVAGTWLRLRAAAPVTLRGAAAEIDERLMLEGRVATALALTDRTDAFARAAVEDGERTARTPGMSNRVDAAFRIRWPALAPWIPVAAVALSLLAWMVPVRMVAPSSPDAALQPSVSAEEAAARAEAAEARVRQAVQSIETSPEAQERLKDLLASVTAPQPPSGGRDGAREAGADAARREAEAAQRAAALEERLSRELDSADAQAVDRLRDAMARLPEAGDQAKQLSQALKTGDLEGAMKQMDALARQAAGGDPKAAAQARQALESLAAAIEKSAAQPSAALQQALRQAGLDPGLASDPAAATAAAEAASRSGKLSPQQAEQVKRQAQAQQKAQQQAKQMAQGVRECKGGSSASGRAAASRQAADRRMNAALQMAFANSRNPGSAMPMPWQLGFRRASGEGAGKGSGGAPKTDGNTKAIADGTLPEQQESAGDGNPLDTAAARDFVRAPGVPVGVSSEQVKAVAAKVAAGLEEGSEEDPVPGRLKEAHKRYFEQWKRRLDPAPTPATPASPPAPPKPAG